MRIALLVLIMFLSFITKGQENDLVSVYKAILSSDIVRISGKIAIYEGSKIPNKDAYLGVLLMKKAALVKSNIDKLSSFIEGRSELEAAIARDSNKIEFRFFRLIIQEHAPKFLCYYGDIQNDCIYIRSHYRDVSTTIKQFIIDYSQNSKALGTLSP